MEMRHSIWTVLACSAVLGLGVIACGDDEEGDGAGGGGGELRGTGGDGGTASGGTGGRGGAGGSGGDGGSGGGGGSSEPEDERTQGIFATVEGVKLRATLGDRDGFTKDASLDPESGYSHVVASADEQVEDERETWTLWFPRAVGVYECGMHTDGPEVAFIEIPNTKGGRSGASSGVSAQDCSLEVIRYEPDGIIEGTFSGILGGALGQAQTVTDGSFYFDNRRGGGDCDEAQDPGIPAGEFGATVSITRLDVEGTRAPKYLRCGQNLRLDPARAWLMNVNLSGGRADMAPSAGFTAKKRFYGAVDVNLQLSGLDRTRGQNENCAFAIFEGFRTDRDVEAGSCKVNLSTFDEELWEGSFEARMGLDENVLEIKGSFRIPAEFEAD